MEISEEYKTMFNQALAEIGKDDTIFVYSTGKLLGQSSEYPEYRGIYNNVRYVNIASQRKHQFDINTFTNGEPEAPIRHVAICKELTQDRYDDLLDVMPPIYISAINNKKMTGAFAISEANDKDCSVILWICFKHENRYFETLAEVFTPDGKSIQDTNAHCYQRGYISLTTDKTNSKVIKSINNNQL